jgi:hypothetical protein
MRQSTALLLTAPTLAALVSAATTLIHPNILGMFLAPLMYLAFLFLIFAVAIASKHQESTSRGVWALLTGAGAAQIAIFLGLGSLRS